MINIKPEGILAIQRFLIANHKNGRMFECGKGESVKMLAKWIIDTEDSHSDDGLAMIEIPGINSRTGKPITLTINHDMYDVIDCEFSIVVSNIGTVLQGLESEKLAYEEYNEWVTASKEAYGRVSGEDVTLFRDGEIIEEHIGHLHNQEN